MGYGLLAAIEAEAQAQAICMQTKDFERRIGRSWRKKAGFRGGLKRLLQAPGRCPGPRDI